jgi:hypothetical protein
MDALRNLAQFLACRSEFVSDTGNLVGHVALGGQ